MRLEQIHVGPRARRQLGDIASLAASIQTLGLLHPVVVTPDGELIAGVRRLAACRSLGWTDIPVTIVPIKDITLGEHDENVMRLDFTIEEKVAIGRRLEERVREEAKRRMIVAHDSSGEKPELSVRGDTRDIVGHSVGMGGTTYQQAKEVITAAEANPALAPIVEEMNLTGKVAPALRKVRQFRKGVDKSREATAQRREQIRELAKQGYSPAAISRKVGVVEQNVSAVLNAAGIQTVSQRIGASKRIDSNKVIAALVDRVLILPTEMSAIEWDDLDRELIPAWMEQLTDAVRRIGKLRSKLGGVS